jgi:hypothetical protein
MVAVRRKLVVVDEEAESDWLGSEGIASLEL